MNPEPNVEIQKVPERGAIPAPSAGAGACRQEPELPPPSVAEASHEAWGEGCCWRD